MLSYLAGRLDKDRRRRFVGRVIERDLFRSVIAAPELPFNVLYVFGAGGVGNGPYSALCAKKTVEEVIKRCGVSQRASRLGQHITSC